MTVRRSAATEPRLLAPVGNGASSTRAITPRADERLLGEAERVPLRAAGRELRHAGAPPPPLPRAPLARLLDLGLERLDAASRSPPPYVPDEPSTNCSRSYSAVATRSRACVAARARRSTPSILSLPSGEVAQQRVDAVVDAPDRRSPAAGSAHR